MAEGVACIKTYNRAFYLKCINYTKILNWLRALIDAIIMSAYF